VVAFLEVWLVAVGGQQLGVGEVAVVADERELAVGRGCANRARVPVSIPPC